MKRVLLTGASGFIGSHCLPALVERDFEVHAVSRSVQNHNAGAVHFHQTDLLDRNQVLELVSTVNPTHLLHLAWYALPGKYWTSEQNLRWVQASLDLFQAFAAAGGRRLVGAGSCAEYEWGHSRTFSESETPLRPATLYGACKHALQSMLTAYAKTSGFSAAWGRIFFVYGPNESESRLVPSVIRALLRGEPAPCTHGKQVRDYLYVEDVAEALVTLLDSSFEGTVNIGSGKPLELRDLVTNLGERLHRPELIQLNALPATPDEPEVIVADTSTLTRNVGWTPGHDLNQGIQKSIEWWRLQASAGRDLKSKQS